MTINEIKSLFHASKLKPIYHIDATHTSLHQVVFTPDVQCHDYIVINQLPDQHDMVSISFKAVSWYNNDFTYTFNIKCNTIATYLNEYYSFYEEYKDCIKQVDDFRACHKTFDDALEHSAAFIKIYEAFKHFINLCEIKCM